MARPSTTSKHEAVYNYFVYLFDTKRVRYEDCIKRTAEKYFYSTITVEAILRKSRREEAA